MNLRPRTCVRTITQASRTPTVVTSVALSIATISVLPTARVNVGFDSTFRYASIEACCSIVEDSGTLPTMLVPTSAITGQERRNAEVKPHQHHRGPAPPSQRVARRPIPARGNGHITVRLSHQVVIKGKQHRANDQKRERGGCRAPVQRETGIGVELVEDARAEHVDACRYAYHQRQVELLERDKQHQHQRRKDARA